MLTCRHCLQTWAALRAQGIKTPQIAAWQRVPAQGVTFSASAKAVAMYPYVLNVYNNPSYAQVLFVASRMIPCIAQ